eukprot:gene41969-55685_t
MRKTALSMLCTLSANEVNNRERMVKDDLGLLRVLVSVVLSDDEEELENALGMLRNLSMEVQNREFMCSKDLGLLPALITVLSSDKRRKSNAYDARMITLEIMWNLSSGNRVLGSHNLGLLSALLSLISSDSGEARLCALGVLYNICQNFDNIPNIVAYKGIPVILATLQSEGDDSELLLVSLIVLMLAARHESAARALLALD